ncbi:MAG: hypothetical protein LBP26_03060, partial [Clostridiales bacterium]|nr:hypothetical protein [Clostridiales bacterium]
CRRIPKIPLCGGVPPLAAGWLPVRRRGGCLPVALGVSPKFPSAECLALSTGLARKLARPTNGFAV